MGAPSPRTSKSSTCAAPEVGAAQGTPGGGGRAPVGSHRHERPEPVDHLEETVRTPEEDEEPQPTRPPLEPAPREEKVNGPEQLPSNEEGHPESPLRLSDGSHSAATGHSDRSQQDRVPHVLNGKRLPVHRAVTQHA